MPNRLLASDRQRERHITTTTWLPGRLRRTGILQVHSSADTYTYSDALGWLRSLDNFKRFTGLGPVLDYFGITVDFDGCEGEMRFPTAREIARRRDVLNATLPPKHSLPKIAVTSGGGIHYRRFLELTAQDTIGMADGHRGWWRRAGSAALTAAHDIAFHFPSRLALDPQGRQMIAEQCRVALTLPNPYPGFDEFSPAQSLNTGLDTFLAPPNMGAGKFGPTEETINLDMTGARAALWHISHAYPGGAKISRERSVELGELSLTHVAFLGAHVQNMAS